MVTRVNVVTRDAVLARRLVTFARRIESLQIGISETPLPETETDAYVIPVDEVGSLLDGDARPPTWLPVVAYGREEGLRAAFLAGCRDYLKDPWTTEELSLRISRLVNSTCFATSWGKLKLCTASVSSEYGTVELSLHESRILRVLLAQLGTPVPRPVLYYALWGRTGSASRTVDVHISFLRKKLKVVARPGYGQAVIRSARGVGYYIPTADA